MDLTAVKVQPTAWLTWLPVFDGSFRMATSCLHCADDADFHRGSLFHLSIGKQAAECGMSARDRIEIKAVRLRLLK